jgi:hypothetical protein
MKRLTLALSVPEVPVPTRYVPLPIAAALVCVLAAAVYANQAPEPRQQDTAATQPAGDDASDARSVVDRVIKTLQDADPAVRARGAVQARNLAGACAEFVEQALNRDNLGEEARGVLKAVLPLLRHRAKNDAAAQAVLDYDHRSMAEGYEKFGRKDPRWDALAREALSTRAAGAGAVPRDAVVAAYRRAVDAGCDDPLVLYLYARNEWITGTGDREAVIERHRDAALALAKTQYPAEWKCRAAARYIEETRARHVELIKICLDNLPAALAETGRPKHDVRAFADLVYNSIAPLDEPREVFDVVFNAYAKARPNDSGPYAMKGERYFEYAWEARGSGVAAVVPQDAWPVFRQHLATARAALEKAWELDPSDHRAPTIMIGVTMGEDAPRRETEKWFRRAMEANPDNREACWKKLYALYPRWGGSHAQMVAFGRECMATQNYWGRLPDILFDAHAQIAKERPDADAYLASPAVWADIEAVHRTFLDAFPTSPWAPWYRNRLAKWAVECQQWDEAVKRFGEIGDTPDLSVFRSKAVYNYYRKKAQNKANNVLEASAR